MSTGIRGDDAAQVDRPGASEASGPVWIATIGLGLITAYLGIVLLLDERVLGVEIADWMLLPLLAAAIGLLHVVLRRLHAHGRIERPTLFGLGTLGGLLALGLVGVDVAWTVQTNRRAADDGHIGVRRLEDRHLWQGEILPRVYLPTEWNFYLHKPGAVIEADSFGEFYDAKMLASPTLRDRVLEPRHVSFHIDEHGFRETTPLSEARIFALGDSFVFGFGLEQSLIWPELLEASSGRPVYNLGVSATGPAQELRVLRYLLDQNPGEVRIDVLLWMIFEGNDLENSYEPRNVKSSSGSSRLQGTVIEGLRTAIETLKRESVIARIRRGELRTRASLGGDRDPTLVDGVRIAYPLYDSEALGPRMFNPEHLASAGWSHERVRSHPNLPRLRETFESMAELAREHGFPVVIVLAPTATRVHGHAYPGLPPISDRPYFLDETAALAREAGFAVVDLTPALTELGRRELLYFRDDHHWNALGNRVVAGMLDEALRSSPIGSGGVAAR